MGSHKTDKFVLSGWDFNLNPETQNFVQLYVKETNMVSSEEMFKSWDFVVDP